MILEGFKSVYPMQCTRLMIYCGMAVMRMEMLVISRRKMKALTEYGDNDTDFYDSCWTTAGYMY
jgi:hypothetical protein